MTVILNFNESYEKFLKLYCREDFELKARPTEKLSVHVCNMLKQLGEYLETLPVFKKRFAPLLYTCTVIAIISHDFGKISPYFQYKMYKKKNWSPIPEKIEKYSFHTLSSVAFAFLFIDKCEVVINLDEFNYDLDFIKDFIKGIVGLSIINHHSHQMKNPCYDVMIDVNLLGEDYLNYIFKKIKDGIHPEVINRFCMEMTEGLIEIINKQPFNNYFKKKKKNIIF
ncbi:MAG: CRISPR-associated endonuclease Cas3'', partial [Promethearchaeota archaeon]